MPPGAVTEKFITLWKATQEYVLFCRGRPYSLRISFSAPGYPMGVLTKENLIWQDDARAAIRVHARGRAT